MRTLGALGLGQTKTLPQFKKVIKAFLRMTNQSPAFGRVLVVDPALQDQSLKKILLMRQKLTSRTFTGTLTTIPLLSIISPAKTISSRALLYFVEPELIQSPIEKNLIPRSTWLSGEYYIVGYNVEIDRRQAITSFDIIKNPERTQGIEG